MKRIFWLPVFILLLSACNNKSKFEAPVGDGPESGSINMSIDESFAPVMKEQISMYEASFPNAHLNATYKSEPQCFKDFFNDTATRMVIVTRPLSVEEDKYMKDTLGYYPQSAMIAFDAVCILLNRENTDSTYTLSELKDKITGKLKTGETIVFDGLNATSTYRYISDSILRGEKIDTSVVKAKASSREVVDFVRANPKAIGLVGFSWIGNPEIKEQAEAMKNIRLAYVQCDRCVDSPFVAPTQPSINTFRYPMVRSLYYVLKENYAGLGTGFTSFLKYERGQLIFSRFYLGTMMDFDVRKVDLSPK